jgi:encapsulating protein for peroxidase
MSDNHLLRSHAPISETGWEAIDREARERLVVALAARRLVDFAGPRGREYSATNLGRTEPVTEAPCPGVTAVHRRVLPLAEVHAPFTLAREELRGEDFNDYPRPVVQGRRASPAVWRRRPVRPRAWHRGLHGCDRDGRARRLPALRTSAPDPRRPDRVVAGRPRRGRAQPARRRLPVPSPARTSPSATTTTTPRTCACTSSSRSASASPRRKRWSHSSRCESARQQSNLRPSVPETTGLSSGGQRHLVDIGLRARDRVVIEARES